MDGKKIGSFFSSNYKINKPRSKSYTGNYS